MLWRRAKGSKKEEMGVYKKGWSVSEGAGKGVAGLGKVAEKRKVGGTVGRRERRRESGREGEIKICLGTATQACQAGRLKGRRFYLQVVKLYVYTKKLFPSSCKHQL